MAKRYYKLKEVAAKLGYKSLSTLHYHIEKKTLKAEMIGRDWLVSEKALADFEEWLKTKDENPNKEGWKRGTERPPKT